MRRAILWLLSAAVVVAAAWWLAHVPGDFKASFGGREIETSMSLAIAALVVAVLLLFGIVRLAVWLIALPGHLAERNRRRTRRLGDLAVTRTLVALAAGDHLAKDEAARARSRLGDTAQTLLLAAEADRLSGDEEGARATYQLLAAREDSAFLGLRGLFRQAIAREDWPEAATLAAQAEAVRPGAAWLREERSLLAVRTGDWRQALALAGPEAPRTAYATAAALAEPDPVQALRLAKRAWTEDPGFVPAAIAYAARLRANNREKRAQEVLRTTWKASPQPDLATLALAPPSDAASLDAAGRRRVAERLIEGAPEHPESHFLLATIAGEAHDLAGARRHLEAARRGGMDDRRLFLALADLEAEERGDTEAGRTAQREALRRAASTNADAVWRCAQCGTALPEWRPVCPACHTAGRVNWGAGPLRALAAPLR